MRHLGYSGGLELGPADGPWIEVAGFPRRSVSLDEAEAAVQDYIVWQPWDSKRGWAAVDPSLPTVPTEAKGMRGMWAVDRTRQLVVRFLYPGHMAASEALYTIEEVEGGLPPALAAALLAAAQCKRDESAAPAIIAQTSAMRPAGSPSRHSRKQLDHLAMQMIQATLADEPFDAPSGATDRARFWIRVARLVWEPDVRRRLSHGRLGLDAMLFTSAMATAWIGLHDINQVSVAGLDLQIADQAEMVTVWPHVLEWERGRIAPDALRFLVGDHVPSGGPTVNRGLRIHEPVPLESDNDLSQGLASALLREADQDAVYAPAGGFVLDLPDTYPLRAWGVGGLRVWAHPGGLWVAALDDEGEVGACFAWTPGEPFSPWVVYEEVAPLLNVTLAALWRDLRVAGQAAVPQKSQRRSRRAPALERRPQERRRPDQPHVRVLPGTRLRITGKRVWGDATDREVISRRAHGVRGHLRRLPPDWHASDEAIQIAGEFGVPVPDHYTFIQPYVTTGEGQVDTPAEAVVRARGLAAVMALLG